MALDTDIKAIRDYVAAAVSANLESGVEFSVEDPEQVFPGSYAQVTLQGIDFDTETVGSDVARVTFFIYTRRTGTVTSNAKIEKAVALRLGLLASINPGNVGYQPMVSRADFAQDDTTDGFWEMGLTYSVNVTAPRS